MDLNKLRTFITVAETASLTKAAHLLYLTQPAISTHIKSLENQLNIKLFNRTSRGMELTLSGASILNEAKIVLDTIDKFLASAKNISSQNSCKIGITSSSLEINLSEYLYELQNDYLNLQLSISKNISGVIFEKVLNNELDIGITIGKIDNNLNIKSISLMPLTFCFIAPYSWKNKLENFNWKDIQNIPLISTSKQCAFTKIATTFLTKKGITLNTPIILDQERDLIEFVSMEKGISLIQKKLALKYQTKKKIYIVKNSEITDYLYLIWKNDTINPVTLTLINIMKKNFRK